MPGRDQGDVPEEVSFINTQLSGRYVVISKKTNINKSNPPKMSDDNNAIVVGYGYWGKKVANEYLKLYESGLIKNIYVYEKDQRLLNFKDRRLKIVQNLNQIPREVRYYHHSSLRGFDLLILDFLLITTAVTYS